MPSGGGGPHRASRLFHAPADAAARPSILHHPDNTTYTPSACFTISPLQTHIRLSKKEHQKCVNWLRDQPDKTKAKVAEAMKNAALSVAKAIAREEADAVAARGGVSSRGRGLSRGRGPSVASPVGLSRGRSRGGRSRERERSPVRRTVGAATAATATTTDSGVPLVSGTLIDTPSFTRSK